MSQPTLSTTSASDQREETITPEFIETTCDRLAQGRQVRVSLPLAGRLHIDRPLPFLCVYRSPQKYHDSGTERLVTGEAAHLIAAADKYLKPSLSALVLGISESMAARFGAFLIVEVWAARQDLPNNGPVSAAPKPAFRIITSKARPPTATIEGLTKALKRIKIQRQAATVEVVYSRKRSPTELSPLILSNQAKKLNCFVIGLEVEPEIMYRKLLLLGLLRMQEMHGYKLNDFLDEFLALCVDVKKPTAYYLLKKMHQDGWIEVEKQKEGNRPVRRIYSITANGERAFKELLRENLGSYSPVQFDGDIGLALMDALPDEELSRLLSQRRDHLEQQLAEIDAVPDHSGNFQFMIEHQARHLQAELHWLDDVISRL